MVKDADLVLKDCIEHKMYLLKKDKGISKTLKKPKGYQNREKEFMTIMRQELKSGQLAFDLGANIGYTALVMCKLVGPTGQVYCVEPDPRNYSVLKKNIKLNNYADICGAKMMAISDTDGEAEFFTSTYSNLGSLSKNKRTNKGIIVAVRSLDSYLDELGILPDFYKMDIEGHEVEVILGMQEIAKKSKSGTKILMEVHPQLYNKKLDMNKALRSIVEYGFYFKYVMSAAIAQPKLFKEKGYSPKEIYKSSGWTRGVYDNITTEDAIYFCSQSHKEYVPSRKKSTKKIVRSILLEKR